MAEIQLWQRVLAERERQALSLSLRVRVLLSGMAIGIVTLTAGSALERNLTVALFAAVLITCLLGLHRAANTAQHRGVALLAAVVDSAVLWSLVGIWHLAYTGKNPVIHLLGHQLSLTTLLLVIINAASLRPLYPLLVAGSSALLHVLLAVAAIRDPLLVSWGGNLDRLLTPVGRGLGDLFLVPLLLLAGGGLIAWFTVVARRTVRQAAELEQEQVQLREQQMQLVLEARVGALGQLVAGVSHEVNSPLGAVRSATDTAEKCLERLRHALDEEDPATQRHTADRALAALERTVQLTSQAVQRMGEVMRSLAGFVQLDRAEQGKLDVVDCVRGALDANRMLFGGGVQLATELAVGLDRLGNAAQLSQAFATIVRNAAESIEGTGTVTVTAARDGDDALVTIRDEGRGMSSEQVASLFAIEFERGARVRARLGLSAAQSAVHRHGGSIGVESQPGVGTSVRVRLPLTAAK